MRRPICHLLVVVLLTLVTSLRSVRIDAVQRGTCIAGDAKAGSCVALAVCSQLKAIAQKRVLTRRDRSALLGASRACPGELYCCQNSEIIQPTTTIPPTPPAELERHRLQNRLDGSSDFDGASLTTTTSPPTPRAELEGHCLQSRLDGGSDFDGASSLTSSFGVFISISKKKNIRCVGSLITPEYVLTAAHCAPTDEVSQYLLYVNARHVVKDKQNLQVDVEPRFVREIIKHEQYRTIDNAHDIALLRLNESVPERGDGSSWPHPVCVPMGPDHDAVASVGRTLQCFGWGYNAEGVLSSTKQWVTLERISLELCQQQMAPVQTKAGQRPLAMTERQLCTVTITGHDAFGGYSGGPLLYQKDGRWFLIGVISFGVGAINNKFPVVSTNVQQYTDWILKTIRSGQ